MFAPLLAKAKKAQTKATASSTSKLAPQRSTLAARPFAAGSIEQAKMLQRSIGNQATLRLLSQRGQEDESRNMTERGTAPGVSADFSNVPAFPPGREIQPVRSTPAVAQAIQQATVENRIAAPPTQAAFTAAMARVRMRDDVSADRSAQLLRAEAVAFGDQILFRSDHYAPDTERGRALIAHELTHLAHQNQTGHRYPQRSVGGDVLSVQFTQTMAEAMSDDELDQQMQILQAHLQSEPDDAGAAENLTVLENVAYGRQGTAQQTSSPTATAPPTTTQPDNVAPTQAAQVTVPPNLDAGIQDGGIQPGIELPPGGVPGANDSGLPSSAPLSSFGNISCSIAAQSETKDKLGHSWIMIEKVDGSKDSYGFWPDDISFLTMLQGLSHQGLVHHPDNDYAPESKQTSMIDEPHLQKGIDYANSKTHALYNLLAFNCATFARSMYKEATGNDAPSGGLLIDSPADLSNHIEAANKERGYDKLENPLP